MSCVRECVPAAWGLLFFLVAVAAGPGPVGRCLLCHFFKSDGCVSCKGAAESTYYLFPLCPPPSSHPAMHPSEGRGRGPLPIWRRRRSEHYYAFPLLLSPLPPSATLVPSSSPPPFSQREKIGIHTRDERTNEEVSYDVCPLRLPSSPPSPLSLQTVNNVEGGKKNSGAVKDTAGRLLSETLH